MLVSPDGVTGRVPLGALPGDKPGTYLIEQLSIAVVPVPQSIGESPSAGVSAKSSAAPGLVLLGNIDFESDPGGESASAERSAAAPRSDKAQKFAALPGTQREIESLKKLYAAQFKKGALKDLERQDATEAAFRQSAPGAQYVHLATHGFFAPSTFKSDDAQSTDPLAVELDQSSQVAGWNPGLLSGIVLAGANRAADYKQDDGILTAAEVADLDLSSARLVVLSACETGLGQIAGGEGALGLQRAFQIAGAQAVVSSLWKVDDAATQLLMTQFYDNLWRKGMPTLAAFRQAQLSLLRGTVDTSALRGLDVDGDDKPTASKDGRLSPRLWAAFVISGNPQ
jgi:CHAT domain-containing protein